MALSCLGRVAALPLFDEFDDFLGWNLVQDPRREFGRELFQKIEISLPDGAREPLVDQGRDALMGNAATELGADLRNELSRKAPPRAASPNGFRSISGSSFLR